MTTEIASYTSPTLDVKAASDLMSQLVINGDLKGLSEPQRVQYYKLVCERTGLDPTTKPFDLINLSGKLVLYANKSATAQLTATHNLRVEIVSRDIVNGLCVVTARAMKPNGAASDDIGVATVAGLQGEAAANAIMKAVTKAKRRAVLSVCGLGMLDETEIDSIPDAKREALPMAVTAQPLSEDEAAAIDMWRDTIEGCDEAETLTKIVADIRKAPQVVKDHVGKFVNSRASALRLIWKNGAYVATV